MTHNADTEGEEGFKGNMDLSYKVIYRLLSKAQLFSLGWAHDNSLTRMHVWYAMSLFHVLHVLELCSQWDSVVVAWQSAAVVCKIL